MITAVLASLLSIFQFHKGTIRTQLRHINVFYQPYFNSIKVQLERGKALGFSAPNKYFNSIKVQLEL